MHETFRGFIKITSVDLDLRFYAISFSIFTLALRGIDVSIAYAIWAGLGTALITVVGIFWFKEPVNALKIASLFVVVAGVIGLNLSDRMT